MLNDTNEEASLDVYVLMVVIFLSGANSIFLKTFFDKKYALPYRVIDAVVYHFLR